MEVASDMSQLPQAQMHTLTLLQVMSEDLVWRELSKCASKASAKSLASSLSTLTGTSVNKSCVNSFLYSLERQGRAKFVDTSPRLWRARKTGSAADVVDGDVSPALQSSQSSDDSPSSSPPTERELHKERKREKKLAKLAKQKKRDKKRQRHADRHNDGSEESDDSVAAIEIVPLLTAKKPMPLRIILLVDLGNVHDMLSNLGTLQTDAGVEVHAFADRAYNGGGITTPSPPSSNSCASPPSSLTTPLTLFTTPSPILTVAAEPATTTRSMHEKGPSVTLHRSVSTHKNAADVALIWKVCELSATASASEPQQPIMFVVATRDMGFQSLPTLLTAPHTLCFVTGWEEWCTLQIPPVLDLPISQTPQ